MDRITREQAIEDTDYLANVARHKSTRVISASKRMFEYVRQEPEESDAAVRKEIAGLLHKMDLKTGRGWWLRDCCNGTYGLIQRNHQGTGFEPMDGATYPLTAMRDNLRELTKPPVQEFAVDDFVTVASGGPAWIYGAHIQRGIWKYQLRYKTGDIGEGFCWETKELTHRDPDRNCCIPENSRTISNYLTPHMMTHSGATDAMARILLDQQYGRVPANKDVTVVGVYLDHISDKDVE